MHRLKLTLCLLFAAFALACALPAGRAMAYSYASAAQEPLLDGRTALFAAVDTGDWAAAKAALAAMQAELTYLDANEDKGLLQAFDTAIQDQNPKEVVAAFNRAVIAEITRRLDGAGANLSDYQAAKVLVVTANRLVTAIEGDLDPATAQRIHAEMARAIDAVGNPGVFGVGAVKADPQDFKAARQAILDALGTAQ